MSTIILTDFTKEAASKAKGIVLKDLLEPRLQNNEPIAVDFSGISRFASPFFNNSFSALALKNGFQAVENIQRLNLSDVGEKTYRSSMDNARLIADNPTYEGRIDDIIREAPKGGA